LGHGGFLVENVDGLQMLVDSQIDFSGLVGETDGAIVGGENPEWRMVRMPVYPGRDSQQ
jgi:hypothetical protein